jgi:hypothetical protein
MNPDLTRIDQRAGRFDSCTAETAATRLPTAILAPERSAYSSVFR